MKVTYAVETLALARAEMEQLFPLHWEEVARDRDKIKLDPDWESYYRLEATGQFHLLVARAEGKMVGYIIHFVRPHLHYRRSLSAITDIYFIHPDFRAAWVGYRLFVEAEKSLKARGVQKIFTGTKVSLDMGKIFERQGYSLVEKLYCKVID